MAKLEINSKFVHNNFYTLNGFKSQYFGDKFDKKQPASLQYLNMCFLLLNAGGRSLILLQKTIPMKYHPQKAALPG